MKNLLLIFSTLIMLTNLSYASFPIPFQSVISIDTIKPDTNKIIIKETTSEYHYRMQKEGFNIDNCMCEDCRKSKNSNIKVRDDRYSNAIKFFGTLGIGGLILIYILVVFLVVFLIVFIFNGLMSWDGCIIGC